MGDETIFRSENKPKINIIIKEIKKKILYLWKRIKEIIRMNNPPIKGLFLFAVNFWCSSPEKLFKYFFFLKKIETT